MLDRLAGIPLVYFFGPMRKRTKVKPTVIRRIGIINFFSIGDNVLMSGVIADLVSAYPQAELVAFTGANNYQLVKLIPGFTEVLKLPITRPAKAIKTIKEKGKFDLVFDFGSWPRISGLYTFFVNADWKVGFRSPGQHRHYVYDQKVDYSAQIHEIDNYRNLVRDFYKGPSHMPGIRFIETANVKEFVHSVGRYCIVHPWPGGYKSSMKQWDNQRWVELIYRLDSYFDTIILTGAPSDNEKCREFENLLDQSRLRSRFINASGKFSLGETAYLLKESHFIVSIDTGISHMSAAFDKPLVCIQGPASSVRWRPYSENAVVVNPDKGTYGYLSYGFEHYLAKENCMENISVDAVFHAFLTSYQHSYTPLVAGNNI